MKTTAGIPVRSGSGSINMSDEEYERLAALYCGAEGDDNCRHIWNAAHPEDQITEDDQRRAQTPVGPPDYTDEKEQT